VVETYDSDQIDWKEGLYMVVIVTRRQSDGHEGLRCFVLRSGPIFDSGMKLLILHSLPAQMFESIDQNDTTHHDCDQNGLWSPEVQKLNMFGRVEGLIRIRAVKDKIGVLIMAEACPPKSIHRSSTGSTDRTISLDAPLHEFNFGA
jgi:hypothetical protein